MDNNQMLALSLQIMKEGAQNVYWDLLSGRRKRFEYFTGITAGNPSGNANLRFIYYEAKNGGGIWEIARIQEFAYDGSDNVTLSFMQ